MGRHPQNSRRQPLGDRHPGFSRCKRARASRRSGCSPRRTSSRCTASRPTRPTRSAAARISSGRSGRSRRISRSRRSCASPSARARTPSIRATGSSPKARNSPRPAPPPASPSSARRRRRCAGSATRSRRATSPSRAGVPVMPATDPLPDDPESWKRLADGDRLSADAEGLVGRRRARHARHPRRGGADPRRDGGEARGEGRLRQGRGLSRKAGRARPPRRGADPRRHARQPRPPLRARLLDPAPPPEGRRARAGALPRRRRSARSCAATR